jgi:hypothetical protein
LVTGALASLFAGVAALAGAATAGLASSFLAGAGAVCAKADTANNVATSASKFFILSFLYVNELCTTTFAGHTILTLEVDIKLTNLVINQSVPPGRGQMVFLGLNLGTTPSGPGGVLPGMGEKSPPGMWPG